MKLILTQEVAGLGISGDVVEVKDGYGRNYLVPRGLAMNWSKGAEKQVESMRRARGAREIRNLDHANEVKAELEALDVTVSARAHDGGHLFGSISVKEVADAIRAAGGPLLERTAIELPGHIKSTGVVTASVRLLPGVAAAVQVNVVAAE